MQDTLSQPTLAFAQQKDREDKLYSFRSRFFFPQSPAREATPSTTSPLASPSNRDTIYFCGNSLGLLPKQTESYIRQELQDWQDKAIAGYLQAKNPWMTYHLPFRPTLSRIAGCLEEEVTVMNALTVNLHLMLLSFYRPSGLRRKILMEAGAFPSDQYAVETQIRWHGYDPSDTILEVHPRPGEKIIREEDILATIDQHKDTLALVLFGGINYYSGQFFDMAAITEAAHRAGALAGFDLAHAIGNVPLQLHDWNVDFAVWCSYKYLNGGPGAVAGAYLHERYARDQQFLRMGGWWGNDESTRFKMKKGFIPKPNADGWSISTAQVFNMVALRSSLDIFAEAGIGNLQTKSRELTTYLHSLLQTLDNIRFQVITPAEPHRRGAQLSLFFEEKGRDIHQRMTDAGIVVDYREPGVIRVAPAPLYNSFEEVYRFYEILRQF